MIAADLLLGTVALAALVLPGWMAARAARVPQPLLAGFVASAVGWTLLIQLLNAAGASLTFAHVGAAWLVVTIGVAWFARSAARPAPAGVAARFAWREHGGLWLVLVPAVAVVAYRAVAQPLFGIDTIFRWNYLAEQMFARGNLAFYPPVTAADYEIYAWPDGIAPTVSSLYFWVYAMAGAARPVLTAPFVIAQYGLLLVAVFALARRIFSDRAAAFALALVACCPVVAWATAMGQETGLTALALTALLLYLPRDRVEESTGGVVWAGLAAGLAGLAREYGIAVIAFGFGLALVRRLSGRALALYVGAALVATAPWYLRNWSRTGNPLFNLDLAGLFPVNVAQAWMNESYQVEFGHAQVSAAAMRFLLMNCWVALLGGLAAVALRLRPAWTLAAAGAMIAGLWFASLGYTAAGFTTAVRVLSPALVLGAILGGAALARWIPAHRSLAGATLALGLAAIDAALRALTLPVPYTLIPPGDWLGAGGAVIEYHERPVYREIARIAGRQRILVLGPNALLSRQGARTVPLWSPEVAFLFQTGPTAAETAARLQAAGIGFILLDGGPANERYLAHSPYFRDPGGTLRGIGVGDRVLLRIVAPP